MKKLLIAISMVLVLIPIGVAQAAPRGASYQGNSTGALQGTTIISTRGVNVYNITLDATASLATMTVYDAAGLYNGAPEVGINNETIIWELEVATAGNASSVDFSTAPVQTYSGLVATVTNGVGYINKE